MGRLSWVVVAIVLVLTGCSGGDEPDTSPSASPAAVDPGPELGIRELDMVPEVSTYTREVYDDSAWFEVFAAYSSPLEGGRVVVKASDYATDPSGETTPGEAPAYWEDAKNRETSANGWTCGTLSNGPSCYRLLTDGLLEISCEIDDCTLDRDELSEVSAMLYEAFSGGSTSGGSSEPPQPCDGVDPDAIAEALGPWLGDGEVELDLDSSEIGEFYSCYVELPPDSLERSEAELEIVRHEYAADTRAGTADCSFGGTSADAVHDSALVCLEGDGSDGTVVSETELVQAEDGDYWWEVFLIDDTFDEEQFDELTDLARTLPAD